MQTHQQTPQQTPKQSMEAGKMDHSRHIAPANSQMNMASDMDCCPDCDCSLAGCTTLVLPGSQFVFDSNITSLVSRYTELREIQMLVTPFRPPISR